MQKTQISGISRVLFSLTIYKSDVLTFTSSQLQKLGSQKIQDFQASIFLRIPLT